MRFLPGFAPNVVCEYPIVKRVESIGEEDEGLVLFSGHYDVSGRVEGILEKERNNDLLGFS